MADFRFANGDFVTHDGGAFRVVGRSTDATYNLVDEAGEWRYDVPEVEIEPAEVAAGSTPSGVVDIVAAGEAAQIDKG